MIQPLPFMMSMRSKVLIRHGYTELVAGNGEWVNLSKRKVVYVISVAEKLHL